ncbi:MAG: hypothetical protein M1819_003730 [Sarea resinae]|nr:MAG: hypothetical protein M1819_003730 [Sarea resinae]
MAFLFKSKKHQSAIPPATRDITSSGGPAPATNGFVVGKEKDGKDRPPNQTPTPGSSVNNSLNSLGGANTPSPDQKLSRDRLDHEVHGLRNGHANTTSNPNASLYPWSQRRLTFTTSNASPFPRYGAAVNAVASKEGDVYLMGGLINGSTVKGDLWMVEAGGGNLACFPLATTSEGPGPRVGHASLLVGNAFIVYGGDTKMDDRDMQDDTLYLLNTATRQWSRAMPPGPRPAGRYGHTLNLLGSKIYVFGGQVEGYFFNDLACFDLNALQLPTNRWEILIASSNDGGPPTGQIPPARSNHTIISWNDKLYLFGGTNGIQWFNDVWSYDPRTNLWTQLDCIGYIPAPREGHAAALVNDVMYIFGGRTEEGNDLGDLAAFRISSRRWYTFQNMGPSPSPRSGHSMTAFGKMIVVLAGEPSSAPRDPSELSLMYILDTSKIRYPNDQPTSGERVQGNRRPSGGEKSAIPQGRVLHSREGMHGPIDGQQRRINGAPRESVMAGPNPFGRGTDPNQASPSGPGLGGPGSRLPRASIAQAPSGPPPQQQAPPPRTNGIIPSSSGPRSKTPTRVEKGHGPPVDTVRAASLDKENRSPVLRQKPPSPTPEESPTTGGRRTPTQQQPRGASKPKDPLESPIINGTPVRSRSRSARGQDSLDSVSSSRDRQVNVQSNPAPQQPALGSDKTEKTSTATPTPTPTPQLDHENQALRSELEAAKSQNAWFASELALARKAGYHPNQSNSPILDERTPGVFGDDDRPLIEALLGMRAELAKVQGSVESHAIEAAQKIAEVERQRDAAVSEAVYAKAKLAAHGGGSRRGTPQSDSREGGELDHDHMEVINRRLASSLSQQTELKSKLDLLNAEVQAEKQARHLAEETADASQRRISELDTYKERTASESESLRAELYEAEKTARDEAAKSAEVLAAWKLLQLERDDLKARLEEAVSASTDHSDILVSLRDAVTSSTDKAALLEKKLEEERGRREAAESDQLELKSELQKSKAELEALRSKLQDVEDLAERHAEEARIHRQTIASGLEKLTSRESGGVRSPVNDGQIGILQQQVQDANALVRKNQEAADAACDKLRRAEERIAGLEAYQEQASREGLSIRKQLQTTMREAQSLQAQNTDLRQHLASTQLEANAIAVQHGALKDILGERGISAAEARRSRSLESPGSRYGTPEQLRLRELEQQLEASLKAQRETKSDFEVREQEADKMYREKLEQLENDYQSAVHYVKGTEKMLKRMKDELAKYKSQNAQLQEDLEEAQKTSSSQPSSEWEEERQALQQEIEDLHQRVRSSVDQLEQQMHDVRDELRATTEERDHYKTDNLQVQHDLSAATEQARADIEQLKSENALLETRAVDAEQKVALLLDQVESSVDTYRRQSQQVMPNGLLGHHRNLSNNSATNESAYGPDNRNSVALDSLASELETLRTHWETTNKNYRLSNTFDFEKAPVTSENGELSTSLANWRKRLDLEELAEDEKEDGRGSGQERGRGMNGDHLADAAHPNLI